LRPMEELTVRAGVSIVMKNAIDAPAIDILKAVSDEV